MPSTLAPETPHAPPPPPPVVPACENCGAALTGPYCARCGQHVEDRLVSVRQLVSHFAEHLFGLDNRLYRTLGMLFRRPGRLTSEYLTGRRARYVPPLRLYLTSSFLLFFILALLSVDVTRFVTTESAPPPAEAAQADVPEEAAADGASAPAVAVDPKAAEALAGEDDGRFRKFMGERLSYVSENQESYQAALGLGFLGVLVVTALLL